jgi:CheY-like chemotaxis protein
MPRVLVIDDEENVLSLIRKMLERAGYEVLEAPDGRKGIGICQSRHVDLVITDIIMPEMEGLEVIIGLRKKLPDLKIICMSGGARLQPGDYLNLACALGANRTLTKPFEREELLEAVRELVG